MTAISCPISEKVDLFFFVDRMAQVDLGWQEQNSLTMIAKRKIPVLQLKSTVLASKQGNVGVFFHIAAALASSTPHLSRCFTPTSPALGKIRFVITKI